MQYSLLSTLLLALSSLPRVSFSQSCRNENPKTIVVDQSGGGQFTKVQQAINSIPAENSVWTRILVKPGIYKEQVEIPANKPCIVLEGYSARNTIIEWGAGGQVDISATFSVSAENFKAKNIGFKNTYNQRTPPGDLDSIKPAPAFEVMSDKASFYHCSFIGVQDTLTDSGGRHYFDTCYIEGAADFIWGNGQSIYQGCKINASTSILGGASAGFIAAQGRESSTDTNGFVFKECAVVGTGPVYLGRAYRQYSRVLFYESLLSNVVVPLGWDPWHYAGKEGPITFAESRCTGAGADTSKRVRWAKKLSAKELQDLTNVRKFINQDGWLEKQPF